MNQPIALISELVSIDHGKYIVKVAVNSQGVILGTGLAAAETIEIAEDRARERALAIIHLTVVSDPAEAIAFSPSQSSKQSVLTNNSVNSVNSVNPPTPETTIQTEVNSQTESIPLIIKSTKNNNKPQKPPISTSNQPKSTSKLEITPIANSNSESTINFNESLVETQENHENQLPLTQPDNSPNFNFTENNSPIDNHNQIEENEPTLPLEFPIEIKEIKSKSAQIEQSIVGFEDENQTGIFNSESELNLKLSDTIEAESRINLPNNPSDNIPEIMDFNQIIDQTAIEMKRLNWSQEQGKKYLLETYGKKSRHLLSDEELIEFLNYLKTQ